MEHRALIAESLKAAVDDPDGMASRIQAIIEPYLPVPIDVELRLVLVAGSNSCGWTTGASDAFFVDLRCIRDDVAGMELLAAHEIYHVAQGSFMHRDNDGLSETQARVTMILRSMLSEGGAAYVADFMKIENPGHYGRFNRREYEKNFRRLEQPKEGAKGALRGLIPKARSPVMFCPA